MKTKNNQILLTGDFTQEHEIEVMVQAIRSDGRVQAEEDSPKATLTIAGKSDPPDPITDPTATGGFEQISLSWSNPTTQDLLGVRVYRSTGINYSDAQLLDTVRGSTYTDMDVTVDTTYYYWFVSVNTSGIPGTVVPDTLAAGTSAAAVGITSTNIDDFAVTASKIYTKIPVLSGDSWSDNSPGAGYIAWNSHSLYYDGVEYSITAGNSNKKYIYATIPAPPQTSIIYSTSDSAPTRTDTTFIIATNVSGTHNTAWNAIANQVIGTAYILDAAITNAKITNLAVTGAKIANATIGNAKISDLSADKLTAGTIDASVITVTNLDADNITAGSITLSRVSDSGSLAAKNDVGASDCDTTIISGGKIITGLLTADNIEAGTLTGRKVQTASTGQRTVLDNSDNTLKLLDTSDNVLVLIDDSLGAGVRPGIQMNHTSGGILSIDNNTDAVTITESKVEIALGASDNDVGLTITGGVSTAFQVQADGDVLIGNDETVTGTATVGNLSTGGYVSATGTVGTFDVFKVDGTQVVTNQQSHISDPSGGSFIDAEARTAIDSILSALETHGLLASS